MRWMQLVCMRVCVSDAVRVLACWVPIRPGRREASSAHDRLDCAVFELIKARLHAGLRKSRRKRIGERVEEAANR